MLGPCAAGTAYIPGLSDFVPMVVGQGAMALAGPHLTKAVTGEEISMEDLGGAKVHCRKSGVGDLECTDDAECIEAIKTYLSFFPSNCEQKPPLRETDDPDDRMSEKLLDIVPESSRHPYDMYEVIAEIVDDGEYFDIKPRFARTIITCLARFGGMPVGIVANQPKQLGGILENDSADKAARFVNLCDAFSIPLVFLQDVPGFMVGSKVEHAGIIRHGAKMLYAVSRATVPKITVVVRKAYGAGYYVMNGKAYEPDLIVAWPSAEISVMGAEGAVNIIGRSAIEASDDPEATREEMLEAVREQIDVYIAAKNALIDDVIDPRETRPTIIRGAADGEGQAGRAAVEEARGDAGMKRGATAVRERDGLPSALSTGSPGIDRCGCASPTAGTPSSAGSAIRGDRGHERRRPGSTTSRAQALPAGHLPALAASRCRRRSGSASSTARSTPAARRGVGKVKRIRANPRVLVAPCDSRGKPLGPGRRGTGPDRRAPTRRSGAERAIQAQLRPRAQDATRAWR